MSAALTPCPGMSRSLSSRAEKVPFVAGNVDEDCDAAVRLSGWRDEEHDPMIEHSAIGGVEVVGAEKQSNASGVLSSDCCSLALAGGLSEE